ncbi:response regulator [Thiolapillus sp.]
MQNIRQQILFIALLPALLLIVALSVFLLFTRLQDLEQQFYTRGNNLANQLATASINSILSSKHNSLILLAEETQRLNPDILGVKVLDSHGLVLLQTGNEATPTTSIDNRFEATITTSYDLEDIYRYYPDQPVPQPQDGQLNLGKVLLWLDSSPLVDKKRSIVTTALLLTLLALLLTALLALFLSQRLAKPLEQLTRAARDLRSGKLGARVAVNASGEIGELQAAFNEMADEISIASENLHAQVDQATIELQESMEILEIRNVELDLARKRAVEASRVKSEFLANMSHEIRTPMNGILGFTNLLRDTKLNQTQKEYLETIKLSSNNLLTIINDILDLSKLEAGKLVLEQRPFSLRQCVHGVISLLAPLAHQKKLELVPLIYNDVPDHLLGDATRVAQVITNLVSNAIKFTEQGQVVLRIATEAEGDIKVILNMSITDTGMGIPAEDQTEIFSAFSQGQSYNDKTVGGTGLGLSICKRLVETMHGSISLSSTPGVGSCFEFCIELEKDAHPATAIDSRSVFSSQKLWVVEPNPAYSLALNNMLSDLGVVSDTYTSYEDTITALKQGDTPEILILAIGAKEFSRESTLSMLETIIQFSAAPVLALLGSSDQSHINSILDLGASRCLSKPVKPGVLAQTMNEILFSDGDSRDTDNDAQPSPSREDWLANTHVLVADDNAINRLLMEKLLQKYGATIISAEDGKQAVDAIKNNQIDIALIDIHMPAMNGFEAAEKIRHMPEGESLPLIAMTADAMGRNRTEIKHSGFDTYLIKPFEENELLSLLKGLLEAGSAEGPISRGSNRLPHAEESELAVYDRSQAMRITGNSASIAATMLDQLMEALPSNMQEIARLVEEKDWKALWQSVHKMQGIVAVCAVPAFSAALNRLQLAVQNKNGAATDSELQEVHREMERLVRFHTESAGQRSPEISL